MSQPLRLKKLQELISTEDESSATRTKECRFRLINLFRNCYQTTGYALSALDFGGKGFITMSDFLSSDPVRRA